MNPSPMQKRVIGQYRITGVLGQGGMGVVYAAEHALLGRPAAVKVLRPELSQGPDAVTRFFNEARSATVIGHPGIVEIYDFGWTPGGTAFLVMELLQGETLRARRGRAPLPWSTALAFTRQIAGALGAAHAKGIVHRDLKPDNIFLVSDPEVAGGERIKLLDFGLAKLVTPSPGQYRTRTGEVMGTSTYMAPEQCRGVAVDSRADLYSLGCILFELCTGQPPFVGEGEGDVLGAHIHLPPPTISSLTRNVPPELETLVQRLLAKAPIDRVQTADEVIRLVDAATIGVGAITPGTGTAGIITSGVIGSTAVRVKRAETTLSSAASTHLRTISRAPRRRAVIGGGSLGAIAIAAVIALAVAESGGAEPVPPTTTPDEPPAAAVAPRPAEPPTPPPPGPRLPTTVDVVIESAPPGAKVTHGDHVLGVTPYRGTLPRSDRELELVLQLRGHGDRTITVRPSEAIRQAVKLVPTPTPPPTPPRMAPPRPTPSPKRVPRRPHNRVVNPFD